MEKITSRIAKSQILVLLAVFVLAMLLTASTQAKTANIEVSGPGDIYISEVFEPNGGTGKYVELYNAGATAVDLNDAVDDISIRRYSNAGTSPFNIDLTGIMHRFSNFGLEAEI